MIPARHRFALALLALLALTLFLPALVKREVFTLRDHFDYFQPLRTFTAEELSAGRLPLWNPYSASGEPWLANPQTGVFYPPQWLHVVLPFETAYVAYLFLHLALMAWGTYLLFARDVSPGAAMIGAAAFVFSGPVLSLVDVSNNFATLAWIPLALWCAREGAWKRGALCLALAFLGGEPFFAALGALLYAIVRRKRDVLATALLAFGLCAVQLIPFLEYVAMSDRAGGMRDALILHDSMSARDWLRAVLPSAAADQQFIPIVYIGAIVLVLALIGLATKIRSRVVAGWIALLVLSIVIASGPAWLAQLPLTLFRYPARLVPFAALALAALAALGWERIRRDRRWIDLLMLLVIVADLRYRTAPLFATAPYRRDVVPYEKSVGNSAKFLRAGEIDVRERAAWMAGYLNLYDRRFDEFTAAPLANARYVRMHEQLLRSPTFESVLYAGVTFVLTRESLSAPWIPVATAGSVHVFRNSHALPMAGHIAPDARTLRRGEWSVDTSSARITINAPSDGTVVLRQQMARGWRVTVDGEPAEALAIDDLFRGVHVKKGRHIIEWRYRPPSLFIGAAMTIATLFTLQVFVFVKRRRARFTAKNFSSGPSNLK